MSKKFLKSIKYKVMGLFYVMNFFLYRLFTNESWGLA